MRNIDLTALEIFKTVAEQGGITKAAIRLHRVQSNVTTRVKQLEERLGTKLFLRQHRRLVLSPDGRRLLTMPIGSYTCRSRPRLPFGTAYRRGRSRSVRSRAPRRP